MLMHSSRQRQQQQQQHIQTTTIQYIIEYHIVKLSENDNKNCVICLSELNDIESQSEVIKTKCNHYYHKQCIKDWIDSDNELHLNCPLCLNNL